MADGKTICTVCNYIFDEKIGAPGTRAGQKFEELPEQWRCPDCGADQAMFQPCSCVSVSENEHSDSVYSDRTNRAFLINQTLGSIVTELPEFACIFEQYGLDYCCGGKKLLEQACNEKGISVNQLLAKLNEYQIEAEQNKQLEIEPDWTKTTLRALTEHLITRYHERLRIELPRLSELTKKVARVHRVNHPEMVEVSRIFHLFREQLEQHMQKEELILFPAITSIESGRTTYFGCGGSVDHPIEMMTKEHDDAGEALSMMSKLTNDYTPPEDACNTFKILLHSLAALELEMHQHVHKENNILFPRALKLAGAAVCR